VMKVLSKLFCYLVFTMITVNAQSVRGLVNDGVDEYENENFTEAEVKFKKGIESDIENFESRFNLGDAIYKQGRFDEALEEFKNSLNLVENDELKAGIFHNIGNSFLKNQKLDESIAAYREALKLNPGDMETKYNLSYALKQKQNQQNNQQNQQNQDQNQQDQQNQDQQNQDQQQDQKNEDQQQNKDQQQQPQKPKDEISKDEAQRILDALKNNEAELQKKMREHKSTKSNVEKDW
ncbi:MAG: tetratricopeptide repeat protein, partial [Melioribacteraceae bacterium]|nr:tetratricopeptide repeat protein [Melioribacteraceae bacterium]